MRPKSPQPELSHSCAHPDGCGHGAAEMETPVGNPAGTLADRPEPLEAGRWGDPGGWRYGKSAWEKLTGFVAKSSG